MFVYVLHNNISSDDVGIFSSEEKAKECAIEDCMGSDDSGSFDEINWSIRKVKVDDPSWRGS